MSDVTVIALGASGVLHAHQVDAGDAPTRHVAQVDREAQTTSLAEVYALHAMGAPRSADCLMTGFYEQDASVAMDLDLVTNSGSLDDWIWDELLEGWPIPCPSANEVALKGETYMGVQVRLTKSKVDARRSTLAVITLGVCTGPYDLTGPAELPPPCGGWQAAHFEHVTAASTQQSRLCVVPQLRLAHHGGQSSALDICGWSVARYGLWPSRTLRTANRNDKLVAAGVPGRRGRHDGRAARR